MEHCIQINVGETKYQFNIYVEKEADLTASFSDIISKYILKNPEYIEDLKKIKDSIGETPDTSKHNLQEILKKDFLDAEDINKVLENYAGNTNIYNIASYFNLTRRSDSFINLMNIVGNKELMHGSKLNSFNYNVILMEGVKNRVITNNTRTVVVLNPNSSSQDIMTTLTNVYTLNQLKEPRSWLFSEFKKIINEYEGSLLDGIKNLTMIDKMIYLYSNPNLEDDIKEKLINLVNQDIESKGTVKKIGGIKNNLQNKLFINLFKFNDDRTILSEDGKYKTDVNTLLSFFYKMEELYYSKSDQEPDIEKFKEVFGLTEVDSDLYPEKLQNFFIKHPNETQILYETLNKVNDNNKIIFDKLKGSLEYILINKVEIKDPTLNYYPDPSKISIQNNTKFGQNRMIKVKYSKNTLENTLVITNNIDTYDSKTKTLYVPLQKAINEHSKVVKVIKDLSKEHKRKNPDSPKEQNYGITSIAFEKGIKNIENILRIYSNDINFVTFTEEDDLKKVALANSLGYEINLYVSEFKEGKESFLSKYEKIMPVYTKPLGVEFSPLASQRFIEVTENEVPKRYNLFNFLKNHEIVVPVEENKKISKYPTGESFEIYNPKDPSQKVSVTIKSKVKFYPHYQIRNYEANNSNPGDLYFLKNSNKRYIYLSTDPDNEEVVNCIDMDSLIITKVDKSKLEEAYYNNDTSKIITAGLSYDADHNIIWFKDSNNTNHFYNRVTNKFDESDAKLEFFKPILETISKETYIPESRLQSLLRDNRPRTLYKLVPSKYTPKSDIKISPVDPAKFYTIKDLIEKINFRLVGDKIKIVWFNSRSKDLGFKIKDFLDKKAFTHDGIIYMNEELSNVDSYVHELSHIILAALRTKNPDDYQDLISKIDINNIPKKFLNLYEGLTQNDIREEYLVHLFSKYFTDINSSVITESMDNLSWDQLITEVFNLSEEASKLEIHNLMNGTIKDMLSMSNDDFSKVNKDNNFRKLTKLAALKQELMKNNNKLTEQC